MNKESSDRIRNQSRAKINLLTDSSLKHYFKSSSPRNKVAYSISNRAGYSDKSKDKEKNKENEHSKINTSRGKPPINRAGIIKQTYSFNTIPKDCSMKNRIPHLNNTNHNNERNKKDTNASKPLTAEIALSSNWISDSNKSGCFNMEERSKSFNSTTNTITKSASYIIKLQDEVNELKVSNSKFKNDIILLNEILALLQQNIKNKANQYEEMQLKYDKMVSDLQEELTQLKSTHIPKSQLKTTQYENIIKSILSVLIEIFEIFISKTIIPNSSTLQIENSVDVFESYNNNDEEKRSSLLDQIQSILISKIGFIKRILNVSLNKEMERIQNWSSNINQSLNLNIVSPLKYKSTKTNEDILNSLSKMYINSNSTLNDFDLSVSGNFYAQSPKFNSFYEEGGSGSGGVSHHISNSNMNSNSNSNISNCINSNQKILQKSALSQTEIVQIMSNDSLLDDIKNESTVNKAKIDDGNVNPNNTHNDEDNKMSEDFNSKINVLDCSIGDLVSPSNMINACGSLTMTNELKENMSNFTLDDVQNYDIIGGHS